MKNNNSLLRISICLVFLCSGCATTSHLPERIDPKNKDASQAPADFIADSAQAASFSIFPTNISAAIVSESVRSEESSIPRQNIKDLVCKSGPRFNPSIKLKVIVPKPAQGQPLDKATEAKKEFLANVRQFLKKRFFMSLAQKPIMRFKEMKAGELKMDDHVYNADYSDYFIAKRDNNESQLRGKSYDLPILTDTSKKGIESFYKNLRYQPQFLEKRWIVSDADNWHMDLQFLAFFFPDKTALLVPKVAEFAQVEFDSNGKEPILKQSAVMALTESNETLPNVSIFKNQALYHHVPVVISDYGWKPEGKKEFHTLRLGWSDLSYLLENYTFAFSQSIVEKKFKVLDPALQQNYGINYETHQFSASQAMENNAFIWETMLRENTSLKESPSDDGVLYEVNLDLSDFCELSVSIESLKSK